MSATIPYAPAMYLVYRMDNGAAIGRRFNDPFTVGIGAPDGSAMIEVEADSIGALLPLRDLCVIDGVAAARTEPAIVISAPTFAADGAAECEISGIPDGTIATLRGAVTAGPVVIDDGSIVLTSTSSGAIMLTLDCPPPWRRWEGRVDAV